MLLPEPRSFISVTNSSPSVAGAGPAALSRMLGENVSAQIPIREALDLAQ